MLKTILTEEEHTALPEAVQEHYTQNQDGKFILDVDGVNDLPSVAGLVKTLEKFKTVGTNPDTLQRKLDAAAAISEALGELDADDLPDALEELQKFRESGGDQKVDLAEIEKTLREKIQKKHDKELAEKDEENTRLTKHVEDREIDQAIDDVLGSVDDKGVPFVIPGTRSAVKALLKERGPKVVWEEGEPRGVFAGELGEELAVDVYIQAWARTDEAKAFLPASGNTGTGSNNDDPGGRSGVVNPWAEETFNLTEQGRLVKEKPALAKQLASAAGKTIG